MKIVKINEFLTIKLEDNNETNIYVGNQIFLACKSIFINLPKDSYPKEIRSIDELIINVDFSFENDSLTPEERFWVHCSNLQAWYESKYNTRVLIANLAFPLLKKLTEEGDPMAKRVFKEEIAKRVETKYMPVTFYLLEEGFINYLSREEFLYSLLNKDDAENLLKIERELDIHFSLSNFYDQVNSICIEEGEILALNINNLVLNEETLEIIMKLKSLHALWLIKTNIKKLPHSIGDLENLHELNLSDNKISELPESLKKVTSLNKIILKKIG